MAEKEPEKDRTEEITPRRGAIELMQVVSVLLIPVAGWLLLSDHPRLAGAVFAAVVVLLLLPLRLVKVEVDEAEKARAAAEAKRAEAGLRSVEAKGPEKEVESAPYHSSREGTEVYHIFLDCYVGNNIEKRYRTDGMGDKTLCEICEDMKKEKEKKEKAA